MHAVQRRFVVGMVAVLVAASLMGGAWPGASALAAPPAQDIPDAGAAVDNMILSYAAKFVCTVPLQAGQFFYGPSAPVVSQETQVLVHNPNGFPVTLFKKAVRAPVENPTTVEQGVAPGKYVRVVLRPDFAFHIDCDDIAKLLTGNPAATALSTFGIGNTVEGFVVIGIGAQTIAGTNIRRFAPLDVTGEYVRSAEFLKKDIHYQPWWRYWWWNLPWRLGYAYQRVLPAQPGVNIDCRDALYRSLQEDAAKMTDATQRTATQAALEAGQAIDGSSNTLITAESPPALIALIGRCDKVAIGTGAQLAMSVDYLLVSNKGPTDPDPRNGTAAQVAAVRYPWIPGRWYDLALVTPQNLDVDMHAYFQEWQAQRWVRAGETVASARQALVYWFPYWCGWGYWWWWWNGSDCVDIAVGEAESLDVEQITPVRVLMPQWPPVQP